MYQSYSGKNPKLLKQLFVILKAYEVNKTKQVINRVDKKVNKERKTQIFYQFHPIWFHQNIRFEICWAKYEKRLIVLYVK